MQGAKLNCPSINKQAYSIFRVFKHFNHYIHSNNTKVVVPKATISKFLVQQELGERT